MHEGALAGVELRLEGRRRLLVQRGGIGEILAGGGCGQNKRDRASITRIMCVARIRPELGEFRFKRAATARGTKAETSPPMPAICRTKVAVIGRTAGDAAGTWSGRLRHGGVHPGQLHLIVEIGAVADAADQHGGTRPLRGRHHQIVEGLADERTSGRARHRRTNLLQHDEPVLDREQRRLAGVDPDRQHQPVAQPHGMSTTSRWPLVTGSNDPAKSAVRGMAAV